MTCVYCGKKGHKQEYCFKKKIDQAADRSTKQLNVYQVIAESRPSSVIIAEDNDLVSSSMSKLPFTSQQLDQIRQLFINKDNTTETQAHMLGIYTCFSGFSSCVNTTWILDTGATNYMSAHKSWLTDLRVNNTHFGPVCVSQLLVILTNILWLIT